MGLMKEYADYFFSEPWPEKLDKRSELSDLDVDFIKGSESYREECDRFTLVRLRRNMSMEGFNPQVFDEDFRFHGKMECCYCVVPHFIWFREKIEQIEQAIKEHKG